MGIRSRMIFAPLLLSGCLAPAHAIKIVSADSAGLSLEYNYWATNEARVALQTAQRHCAAYGLEAKSISSSSIGGAANMVVERFQCVR